MINLVCLLEEPSAKEMLAGLFPRLLPEGVTPFVIPFEGKQDLEKQLVRRIRNWRSPNSVFLVMRDQDAGDCEVIKSGLMELCQQAGKTNTVVRIACRELESFYFGDLAAVEVGLNIQGLTQHTRKAKYRNPDAIVNPADELMKLTGGVYQKVSGSRAIGPHLNLEGNTSHSFKVLIAGIRRLVAAAQVPPGTDAHTDDAPTAKANGILK
jgi:hypothetical protein